MFKVYNKDTRTASGVFIVNIEHISHRCLVSVFLTLNIIICWVAPQFSIFPIP